MARNVVVRITLGVVVALFTSMAMNARDLGQWDDPANADLKRWYQDLKQPDNPAASCCGEADAYWADAFEATSDGEYVAIITDPRDDKPLGRIHRRYWYENCRSGKQDQMEGGQPCGSWPNIFESAR
jgi:hypothetical protein